MSTMGAKFVALSENVVGGGAVTSETMMGILVLVGFWLAWKYKKELKKKLDGLPFVISLTLGIIYSFQNEYNTLAIGLLVMMGFILLD